MKAACLKQQHAWQLNAVTPMQNLSSCSYRAGTSSSAPSTALCDPARDETSHIACNHSLRAPGGLQANAHLSVLQCVQIAPGLREHFNVIKRASRECKALVAALHRVSPTFNVSQLKASGLKI